MSVSASSDVSTSAPDELTGRLLEIHEGMKEGEREVYIEALHSPSVTAENLAWSLGRMGFRISASSIRTYRRARAREMRQHEQ